LTLVSGRTTFTSFDITSRTRSTLAILVPLYCFEHLGS
jgi:hypothetical protein